MSGRSGQVDPMDVHRMVSLKNWGDPPKTEAVEEMKENVVVDCGWGKLAFGQTFSCMESLARAVISEDDAQRNVALYLRDPHVVLSIYPQNLFLDPSHTFRLKMDNYHHSVEATPTFRIRLLAGQKDASQVRTIYNKRGMVPARSGFYRQEGEQKSVQTFVALERGSDKVLGQVMAVDHVVAFDDADNGCSLWALAVDPQATIPGVGQALVRHVIEMFKQRGRSFLDLSVMHDNMRAIGLYRKLGFERVAVYCLKNKNPINEPLFTGDDTPEGLNIYARIIIDEARRRGIAVEICNAVMGLFNLSFGGRTIKCWESLSELTPATAMSICDRKDITHDILKRSGLRVPAQQVESGKRDNEAFLAQHRRLVVKPARGEQGQGISVDITTKKELATAIRKARQQCPTVLLEELSLGEDLRIIVIDYQVVAASVRRPASIQGDGVSSVRQLIRKQSRRRQAATHGESRIPMDKETIRCVAKVGYNMDDVLREGVTLPVRKTANLHTGGTIHDVTEQLHPTLAKAARAAARALEMPVTGLDFMVESVSGTSYVIIEANERPGLANHEPQPTAERFIDLLFPRTRAENVIA
ncbi:MAG: N-acetylglutaminylglutamine synthetase [Magnetococcales bacterium]|nr:N-acetylglutaminylglutamine synthetase [Magnetococcales bacterium]